MYVKDTILWHARQCGTMVDVSQIMIAHTITCQIHASRLTTPLRNELRCSSTCTEFLDLLTMKLELLSPLLSDSPFLSSKVFLFVRFSNLTVEWTKWNHVCWGPRKLSILNSFLVFPRCRPTRINVRSNTSHRKTMNSNGNQVCRVFSRTQWECLCSSVMKLVDLILFQSSHSPLTIDTENLGLSITGEKYTVVSRQHMVTCSCSPSLPLCSIVRYFKAFF